ncbi:MAG TPA: hypothetical protein PLN21_07670 [Gemmatales bacterium]|nr:hypothetical protein [Gemmatales bacterium]
MPQTQADFGMKWFKVTISLLLSSATGVSLYFSLMADSADTRNVLSFVLLPLLLFNILSIIACMPSERELAPIGDEYLVDLLVKKPDWQHDHDANAWVSIGKFIRVGRCPEEPETKPEASPLERLVAIKKQGYWLRPSQ